MSPIFFITFSILNSVCLIWFFQFFHIKHSKNFFTIKVFYYVCLRKSMCNFFNRKNFFRPIWGIIFRKNAFIFWYTHMVTNLKFRIFIIIFYTKVSICAWLYINSLDFKCSMICIIVFINYISLLINIHIFLY